MKIPLCLMLFAAVVLTSCVEPEQPPQHVKRTAATQQTQTTTTQQYPPTPQPFEGQGAPPATPAPDVATSTGTPANMTTPNPPAPVTSGPKAKGDYPYAHPVPGKPGYVYSPYVPDKIVDVRGIPPGTEVKDPETDYKKIFLVP